MIKKNNALTKIYLSAFLLLTSYSLSSRAESVIENPSKRIIRSPINLNPDGRLEIKPPGEPAPRLIAQCVLPDYNVRVLKSNGQRQAVIRQTRNGEIVERKIPFVLMQKLSKEMLGQYAAAVVIAQTLGFTDLDYVKIFVVDPQWPAQNSRALIFFYDEDDEVIDQTLVEQNSWVRCENAI